MGIVKKLEEVQKLYNWIRSPDKFPIEIDFIFAFYPKDPVKAKQYFKNE